MNQGPLIYCLINILFFISSSGEDLQFDKLIENVYENYRVKNDHVKSFICNGSTIYQEFLSNGDLAKEIFLTRRLYTKGDDQNHDEYLEMSLNGRVLNHSEMEKQIDEWNRRGKKRGVTNMPLRPATKGFYDYSLLTDTVWNQKIVYRVGFKARSGIDNVINGIAYIDQSDHNVVRIEAYPAKIPGVIKMMKMVYHYALVDGHVVPDSFCFEMKITVKFLINFYDRRIKLTDVYSDYRLNVAIPDTL